MKTPTVLSVDDNEDDQFLLQRAWKKSGLPFLLQILGDGEKAIDYLGGLGNYSDRENFPQPSFILLDLKMPRKNGFEVLSWIGNQGPGPRPPVAILSSSQNAEDIKRAYELGATWYMAKPVDHAELIQLVQLIGQWLENPQQNNLAEFLHFRATPSPG